MRTSLLPPNATELERAIEAVAADRLAAIDVRIARTARSTDCPAELLPWLAHAFSVDVWDDAWPEARKRAVIASSISVHRRKGTLPALIEALGLVFGAGVLVEEWWEFGGEPGTFRLAIPGFEGPAHVALLNRVVDSTKPSHAHLANVRIERPPVRAGARLALVSHIGRRTVLVQRPDLRVPVGRARVGIVSRVSRLGVLRQEPPVIGSHRAGATFAALTRVSRRGVLFSAGAAPTVATVYTSDGRPVVSGNSYVEAS